MLFSPIFERCNVIVIHYIMKVKCFSFCTLSKLASYSDSICCMLWFCSGGVKSCFNKKKIVMGHKTHVISRKILMMKSKDRKCYMYLKFHINPPYIVYILNCILTHTFFFSVSIYFTVCYRWGGGQGKREGGDEGAGGGRRGGGRREKRGGRREKRGGEEGEEGAGGGRGEGKGREGKRGKFCARNARAAPEGRRETRGRGGGR